MVIKIKLGEKKKRNGKNKFSTERQIEKILNPVPNFECQLDKFTQI